MCTREVKSELWKSARHVLYSDFALRLANRKLPTDGTFLLSDLSCLKELTIREPTYFFPIFLSMKAEILLHMTFLVLSGQRTMEAPDYLAMFLDKEFRREC